MTTLRVLRPGPRTTVQDRGRRGWGHLGVPVAGAVDVAALGAVNAALGNDADAAALEIVLGGVELLAEGGVAVAVSGADVPLAVDGSPRDATNVLHLNAGERLRIGAARDGIYAYLGLRGGVGVDAVLGSRCTDTLSGIGPRLLQAGDAIVAGGTAGRIDAAVVHPPLGGDALLELLPGPHLQIAGAGVFDALVDGEWQVLPASDRTAIRLTGAAISHEVRGIASEGLVPGAVQLPPDGQPVVFLANHPVTGGYPVVAVVRHEHVRLLAQRRPGQRVRFTSVND